MEIDEPDYFEKTVETPRPQKVYRTDNSGHKRVSFEENERDRSSRRNNGNANVGGDTDHRSYRSKQGNESPVHGRYRARSYVQDNSSRSRDEYRSHPSRSRDEYRSHSSHPSRSRDVDRDRYRSRREYRDKDQERDLRNRRDRDRYRDRNGDRRERDNRVKDLQHSNEDMNHSIQDETERERGSSRDKEYCERETERQLPEPHRENRQHKEKSEEQIEPETNQVMEPETDHVREPEPETDHILDTDNIREPETDFETDLVRDQRTVFVYQISLKANKKDVHEFFSRAGKVRDVNLITDRISRRSKGVGYIEFYDVLSVPAAIALSGQLLLGQAVKVKPSEAEKNPVKNMVAGESTGLLGTRSARRLFVGNLYSSMTEDDLRKVFEPFGRVEQLQLPRDESGQCKGFGFVQFSCLEDAKNALNLNEQLEIGDQIIKVSAVADLTGMQDAGANISDFDQRDGLALNAGSRAMLMQKLDQCDRPSSGGLPIPSKPVFGFLPAAAELQGTGVHITSAAISCVPSECLVLENMFDPKVENEPEFDLYVKQDVQGECSKFGKLKHVYVDTDNSSGFVYLRYENAESAINAQRALHKRWFAGKTISVSFMVPFLYERKFPDSNFGP